MCLYILSSFWDVRFQIRIKAMLGSLFLLSFVGGLMSYLRYVCYLLIVMSNTCCVVVFVLFLFVLCLVFPMLQVSLDCQFLVAPSVFSGVCLLNTILLFLSTRCLLYNTDSISINSNCFFLSPGSRVFFSVFFPFYYRD